MLTLQEAKSLKYGTLLYHITARNVDGTPKRWRVTGAPKLWKTRPKEVSVPIKHAMKDYDYITHSTLHLLCLVEHDAYIAGLRNKCLDELFGGTNTAIRYLVFPDMRPPAGFSWKGVEVAIGEWLKKKTIGKEEELILQGLLVNIQEIRT